jgi:hypothetical protein
MIEKTIRYEEVKPSKPKNIKPVEQGGRLNYLGKQKTITAPVKWKSGPTHPETHLAYITKQEQDILVKLDLYKSMNGKPNKGPFGLPSLNDGDGSGDGSSGDGSSSSGSGGSGGSDASGDAGESTGDSAGVGGSGAGADGTGAGSGPGGESGTGGVASGPSGMGGSEEGFGIGPNAEAEAAASNAANTGVSGAVAAVNAFAQRAIQNAINNPIATAVGIVKGTPAGLAVNALSQAYSNFSRGVTAPNDYSQATESVQSGPSQSPSGGGGIETIQAYAPTYNPDTGNPTMDAYMRRLRVNLGLPV